MIEYCEFEEWGSWGTTGKKQYELANNLGNVVATVSDELTNENKALVLSSNDYYPFGLAQPDRTYSTSAYRYGFNGQEKSNEIKGEGNSYNAEFWEYDPGLGRRWNLDPRPDDSWSPYAVLRDNPIWMIDLKGDTSGFGTGSSTRDDPANLVGTEAHKVLSDFLRKENAVSLLGPMPPLRWNTTMVLPITQKKPDVVNMAKRQVWELKPISWHPDNGGYSNYLSAKGQIESYVNELNYIAMIDIGKFGLMKGYYRKGSNSVLDAPVFTGMQLYSRDGLYRFTYSVGNPQTGLIYYQAENLKPQPEAVLAPSPRRRHSTEDEKPQNVVVPAATGAVSVGMIAYFLLFLAL